MQARLHNLLKVNPRPREGDDPKLTMALSPMCACFNPRPRVGGDCLFIIFSAEGMQVVSLFYSIPYILY